MTLELKPNKFTDCLHEIQRAIKNTKWENHVFLVGGGVRDTIMGYLIKDIDLVVDIENGGIDFAEWITKEYGCFNSETNPHIFPKFGTASFNLRSCYDLANINIDVVHTRKEQYHEKDGRKPETAFGTIVEDALRRDLTINALYLNISNFELIDPTNQGLRDIKEHILKTPSDPTVVFNDDPLRMLRVIRFASRYGWPIEDKTWLGIVKNAYKIETISQERITDEINKILVSPCVGHGLRELYRSGLMRMILPSIFKLVGLEQNEYHVDDAFEHTISVVEKVKPNKLHRVGALFHDIGKADTKTVSFGKTHFYNHQYKGAQMIKEILKDMKYSNNEINAIECVVRNHMRFKDYKDRCPSNKVIRRFISEIDEEYRDLVLDVIDADNNSHAKKYCFPNQIRLIREKLQSMQDEKNKPLEFKIPINGKDVMKKFKLKSSPLIGDLLNIAKEAWIDDETLTINEVYQILETYIETAPKQLNNERENPQKHQD